MENNGLVLGGIPDDASSVTPNNSAQIIYFKTGTTVSAGNAVRINGNMLVEPYSSGAADTCVGIALTSGTGSMLMEASVAVQVSGIMKVTGGIYKASDSSAGGVAGELCDCSSGTITSREENTADDASDFIIVHSNDLSGAAYVMWLKGSVQ